MFQSIAFFLSLSALLKLVSLLMYVIDGVSLLADNRYNVIMAQLVLEVCVYCR
jgi:hypothetical protein